MTNNAEWLENLRPIYQSEVVIANNQKIMVRNAGDARIKIGAGSVNIRNVLLVPDLTTNLLSVSQTVKNGNKVVFDSTGCKIYNNKEVLVATAKLVNNMYKLKCTSEKVFTVQEDNYSLWHRRLGHLNYEYMNKLRNLVTTDSNLNFKENKENCQICVNGKQTRLPFKHTGSRAKEKLELIHSDVCGPLEVNSLGGARYFLTLIDDYSHKVFIYMLKTKDEVTECFKDFKNFVENQTERKIKILRSDNGGEYLSTSLMSYLKKAGIQHQLTAAYTPEQNGIAERMNRTIIEKVRCMLFDSNLTK